MAETIIYITVLSPIAWFLQNCIHEASHLLVAYFNVNAKPCLFKPYPHKYKGKWHFSRCEYLLHSRSNPEHVRWIYVSPFLFGMCLVGLYIGLLRTTENLCLLPFLVAATGDVLLFWWGYFFGSKESDGKKFRNYK